MAYNFLGLVNAVAHEMNEIVLTSSTFASATGVHSELKNAVNNSIRYINQEEFNWPFNHVLQEEDLTAGVVRYTYPTDAKSVDMGSFRIKRNSTFNNDTKLLEPIDYEVYLKKYLDNEYNTSTTSIRTIPQYVARTPSQEFVLVPPPDQAYELVYEYYRIPVDLELYSDVPTIPAQFKNIIIDGAMYYQYLFRGNSQDAQLAFQKFDEGVKNMRSIYINRYTKAHSTVIEGRG